MRGQFAAERLVNLSGIGIARRLKAEAAMTEAFLKAGAEEELLESEEKFRKISSSAQDAIVMMDSEGDITYWNPASEKIFGYSYEDAVGKNLHALIVPQYQQNAFKEGFEWRFPFRRCR